MSRKVKEVIRAARPAMRIRLMASVELAHARLPAVLAAEPDRPPAHKIADHDPIGVAFADRYLVDADHLRPGRAANSKPSRNAKYLSNPQLSQASSPKNRPLQSTKTRFIFNV
jgi:hypothetical protein